MLWHIVNVFIYLIYLHELAGSVGREHVWKLCAFLHGLHLCRRVKNYRKTHTHLAKMCSYLCIFVNISTYLE
jgi:hypothetical protein